MIFSNWEQKYEAFGRDYMEMHSLPVRCLDTSAQDVLRRHFHIVTPIWDFHIGWCQSWIAAQYLDEARQCIPAFPMYVLPSFRFITSLRMFLTMAYIATFSIYLVSLAYLLIIYLTYLLTFYLAYLLTFLLIILADILFGISSLFFSNTLSIMYSEILSDMSYGRQNILSCIYHDLFWKIYLLTLYVNISSDIFSSTSSDILSSISFHFLSVILSNIQLGKSSELLSNITSHILPV